MSYNSIDSDHLFQKAPSDQEHRASKRKVWFLFLSLLALILLPFLWIGAEMEEWLSFSGAQVWLMEHFGAYAWVGGVGLLLADLVLPIPGTTVMSVMGFLYGTWLGGLINFVGSMGSGYLTYELARYLGLPIARKLAGESALKQAETWFSKDKAFRAVVMSRWLPMLPEAISALAGLAKMPRRRFLLALTFGSFPLSFLFAWVGKIGNQNATLALILSAVFPLALYLLTVLLRNRNTTP